MATEEQGASGVDDDGRPWVAVTLTRESYEATADKVIRALGGQNVHVATSEKGRQIMHDAMCLVRLGLTTLACNGVDDKDLARFIAEELLHALERGEEEQEKEPFPLPPAAPDVCPVCRHAVARHINEGCTVERCNCIAAGVGLRLGRMVL